MYEQIFLMHLYHFIAYCIETTWMHVYLLLSFVNVTNRWTDM